MPYIKPEVRSVFSEALDELRDDIRHGCSAGDLNYLFTQIAIAYLQSYAQSYSTNYARINDVIGALEGAKLEFYRRLAAPYEDTKIKQNGDVYPPGSVG